MIYIDNYYMKTKMEKGVLKRQEIKYIFGKEKNYINLYEMFVLD